LLATILPWIAVLVVAAVSWWRSARRDRQVEAAERDRDARRRADFEAALADLSRGEAERRAQILAEEFRRDPPNSDLAPDDLDQRLLRAARAAGAGDQVRADLVAVPDPRPDPQP
jgi:hypothetical protein